MECLGKINQVMQNSGMNFKRRDLAWTSSQGLKPQSKTSAGTPNCGQLFRHTPVVALLTVSHLPFYIGLSLTRL